MYSRSPLTSFAMSLALAVALAGSALAAGVSGFLEDLETSLASRRAEVAAVADDPSAATTLRYLEKVQRRLDKRSTSKDYAREVKSASKVGKLLTGKLPSETALLDGVRRARGEYRVDLDAARAVLVAALDEPGLRKKTLRKLTRSLKRADKSLAKAQAEQRLGHALRHLSKAAKLLQEYIPERPPGPDPDPDSDGMAGLLFTADLDYDGHRQLFAASPKGWSIEIAAALGEVYHVPTFAAAPDGAQLAFAASNIDEPGLYVVDTDDGSIALISRPADGEISEIAWSPDSRRIAYSAGTPPQLFAVNPDGTGHAQLSPPGAEVAKPVAWSGDTTRVAFIADEAGDRQYLLRTVLPDGTGLVTLSSTAAPAGTSRFTSYLWSPTSATVAYRADKTTSGTYELHVASADGSSNTRASVEAGTTGAVGSADFAWAPDGSAVLYLREDARTGKDALYLADENGAGAHRVSPEGDIDVQSFAWSPIDPQFAFTFGDGELRLGTSAGSTAFVSVGRVSLFRWALDGTWIAFNEAPDRFSPPTLASVPVPALVTKSPALVVSDEDIRRSTTVFDVREMEAVNDGFAFVTATSHGVAWNDVSLQAEAPQKFYYSRNFRRHVFGDPWGTVATERTRGPLGEVEFASLLGADPTGSLRTRVPLGKGGDVRLASIELVHALGLIHPRWPLLEGAIREWTFAKRESSDSFTQSHLVLVLPERLHFSSTLHLGQTASGRMRKLVYEYNPETQTLELSFTASLTENIDDPGTYEVEVLRNNLLVFTYVFGIDAYDILGIIFDAQFLLPF